MKPLVCLTLHDREEHAKACLASLALAGEEYVLAVCADGATFDPSPFLAVADHAVVREEAGGPAVARNECLRFRRPGQDVLLLDSDIVFETDGWLRKLLDTLYSHERPAIGEVSPVIGNPGPPWFHDIAPGQGVKFVENLPVGARLIRGGVMDALGYLRIYGRYGCEDLDRDARVKALGYALAYDTDVVVRHPGTPADEEWKRKQLEECLPKLAMWKEMYAQGLFLRKDDPEPDYVPRMSPAYLSTQTEKGMGSHLPALAWAVEATTGPILEMGTGMYSTPYLAKLKGRLVVHYETHPVWLALAQERVASERHWVVSEVPTGIPWSVVLVDSDPAEERPRWIEQLRGDAEIFVVHDSQAYGLEGVVATFRYQRHLGDAPRTSVVSDRRPEVETCLPDLS